MSRTFSTPLKWTAGLLAFAVLALILLACRLAAQRSSPATPEPQFQLKRAMEDVAQLASAPRPIASDANGAARALILKQLTAQGLSPLVQTALAQKSSIDRRRNLQVTLGMVNNVVVLVPGTAPDHASRPALLLATAYDTGERSVGAAATAAPTAALLEAARMLRAMPPMANDVVLLFLDGERVGGLGARAFAGQHPLARRVGLVLRFDGGGSAGAPVLVGAGGDSASAVRGWAQAAPAAHGGSALQDMYRELPGVQMGDLEKLGSARLHLANVEGSNGAGGIGSRDTIDRLDRRSVETMGATMFALARHFGNGPPLVRTGAVDAVASPGVLYFDLPLFGVVSYSLGAVWALTRLACLLLVMVCCVAVHRGDVSVREIVDAALGFVCIAALLVLAAALVWNLLPSLHRGYDARNSGAGLHDAWFLGGFAALGTALFILLQRGFRRAVGHAAAALGPVFAATIVLLILSWQLPHASYVLVWPLIGTLAAYGLLYAPQLSGAKAPRKTGLRRACVLAAGAVPALLIIGPLVKDVCDLTSPERSELPMIVLALLLGMGSVLLTAQRRFIVRGLGAASLACFTVAGTAAPYGSAPLPQPNRMVYLKDAATWKAYWMMPDMPLDAWSRRFFPGAAKARVQVDAFGWNSRPMWLAQAPSTPVDFPSIASISDNDDGNLRHVRFRLQAKTDVPFIDLTVTGSDAFHSSVNGRLLSDGRTASYQLSLYGMGGQALDFSFDMETDKRAIFEVHERRPGLPASPAGERPASLPPPFTPMTATTIATDSLVFR
ncbi:MAG: M28 family peptidase [Massilia sp.]